MVSNSSFFGSYNQVKKPVSILPIGQSTVFVPEEDIFLTLSGQGKSKKDCGDFSTVALCKDHPDRIRIRGLIEKATTGSALPKCVDAAAISQRGISLVERRRPLRREVVIPEESEDAVDSYGRIVSS